jgi:porin
VVCLGTVLLAGGLAVGAEPEAAQEGPTPWWAWERATGDWGGARRSLEDRGVEIGLGLTAVWQANHQGGIRSHPAGKWTTSWDIEAAADTEKLGLWPGGTLLVYLEGSKGTGIDERYVGSMFGVNGDADSTANHRLQFSEYWYEHALADGLVAIRVGKMDGSRDIDTNAFANDEVAQFLNGALVNNPTIPFPDYALGAQAVVRPCGGFYVAVVGLDANAEGWASGRDTALAGDSQWFVAAEAGVEFAVPAAREAELPGAWRVGVWHNPVRYEVIGKEDDTAKGESGWYVSCDQMVYKERPGADDGQGLGLFFRYGYAPDDYSAVEHFWSCGFQYQGPIPGRDGDVLGLGVASGKLGGPSRPLMRHGSESVVECYYSIVVGAGATLSLDVQVIRHPGADEGSTVVPGLRFQLDL